MAWLVNYLTSFWHMLLELVPWLLLGLIAAGLIKALVPMRLVGRWLGGEGLGAPIRAAVLGAPLPLCSCSVLPAATGLRKQGASRGATASFLISTPETGVDSFAVSYAMLGGFMAVARLIASLVSAVTVGWLIALTPEPRRQVRARAGQAQGASCGCEAEPASEAGACCESTAEAMSCHEHDHEQAADACCESAPPPNAACCEHEPVEAGSCCESSGQEEDERHKPVFARIREGLSYAMTTLFGELLLWLIVGLLIAAAVAAFAPPDLLARWGTGPLAMVVMAAVGIPMYICATASTPLAAALLVAGVSPGTVLVFLLAGPATNLATVGVLRRELGAAAAGVYLLALAGCSIALGLLTDQVFAAGNFSVVTDWSANQPMLPLWVSLPCLVVLVIFAVGPRLRTAFARFSRGRTSRGLDHEETTSVPAASG